MSTRFVLLLLVQPTTPQPAVVRLPVLSVEFQPPQEIGHVEVKRIRFQPRQETGLHLHPCPVVGYTEFLANYLLAAGKTELIRMLPVRPVSP
jgi:hypothetical protein